MAGLRDVRRWGSRVPLRRRVPLLLGVYLLVIATAGGLGWEALVHRDRTLARVEGELAPARDAARRLLSSLVDQETAVRGYVITGDEEFLGPYRTAAPQSRALLAELRELLAPEDRWMGQIDEIASHEERWRVEVAEPEIAATTDRRPGEAAALVATGRGRELFDTLRHDVGDFINQLQAEEERTLTLLGRARRRVTAIFFGTLLASALLTLLAMGLLRRWVTLPLLEMSDALRRVAEGAVTEPVRPVGPPELAAVANDVEAMRRRIVAELDDAVRAREAVEQQAPAVALLRRELRPTSALSPATVQVAAALQPAQGDLAGDWYDLVDRGQDGVALAIVDVSGHGVAAGALALRSKHLLLAALEDRRPPGEALTWLANRLGDTGEAFCTALVIELDPRRGRVRYANGGHPPAFVARRSQLTELGPTGPLVGPLRGRWSTVEIELDPEDLLVAYTDGLIEARDAAGEQFGVERLVEILQSPERGPQGVVDACVELVRTFSGARLDDDLTVVALQARLVGARLAT